MRKLLLPLLTILLFTSCQKQIAKEQISPEKITGDAVQGKSAMIDVCHKNGNGSWNTINISANALPAHLAHGDIVPDADKDGFTKENLCGIGNQDDCNDDDEAINPGATEICENNIDDNCNGQIDENCIPTIQICNQIWMQKNLAVDHYRNGDPIPQVTDPTEWASLTTGAWCYYNNDPANGSIYGKLYNWFAVNDPRGLAPTGWHIPTDDRDIPTSSEWQLLSDCLGGNEIAGGKMKSTSGWNNGGFNNNNNGTIINDIYNCG